VIWLARHGETEDNVARRVQGWCDPPLNPRGIEQAHALAQKLSDTPIAAVYSSQLARARQTATVVCEHLGVSLTVDERLAESRRGEWEGRFAWELELEYPDLWAAWKQPDSDFRFPGGESLAEHADRVREALADIRRGPLPALAVCHGGTIRCALLSEQPEGVSAFHSVEVPNATLVRFK
jgi:probable phosphoglycerate mutase